MSSNCNEYAHSTRVQSVKFDLYKLYTTGFGSWDVSNNRNSRLACMKQYSNCWVNNIQWSAKGKPVTNLACCICICIFIQYSSYMQNIRSWGHVLSNKWTCSHHFRIFLWLGCRFSLFLPVTHGKKKFHKGVQRSLLITWSTMYNAFGYMDVTICVYMSNVMEMTRNFALLFSFVWLIDYIQSANK